MTKENIKSIILETAISAISGKKGITAQVKVHELVDALYDNLTPSELKERDEKLIGEAWVKVDKDNVPEYYKVFQVYDSETQRVHQAWRASDGDNDIYTIDNSDMVLPNVTHFKPLPAPPIQSIT